MAPKNAESQATIHVAELGPEKFSLTVAFAGQHFNCGNYIGRAAAMQAGRLFVERKKKEEVGHRKRSRKK